MNDRQRRRRSAQGIEETLDSLPFTLYFKRYSIALVRNETRQGMPTSQTENKGTKTDSLHNSAHQKPVSPHAMSVRQSILSEVMKC